MRLSRQIAAVVMSLALAVSMMPAGSVRAADEAEENVKTIRTIQENGSRENTIPQIRLSVGNGQSTPQYKAEQEIELKLQIANEGVTDAQNVRVVPVIEKASDWPFEISSMNYELNLGNIKSGEKGEASWTLKVRSDVENKAYKTPFQITYDDGTSEYQVTKSIYVRTEAKPQENDNPSDGEGNGQQKPSEQMPDAGGVFNSEPVMSGGGSGNQSVPRVIVTGFSTEPGVVNAGSNFQLIVHVKNTSTVTAVSNMLFDLQAPSAGTEAAAEAPAFLPASGSSSIYLDRIPAGETRDIAIDLNARADLLQKPYSISMTMKYEDDSAAQFEGSSSLAVPVQQAARFEFSEIELSPDSIAVGEEANLTCSIYNTGRVKLYNVKVKFSGKGISGKDVFVGNLDSGATGTIDGMLTGETKVPAGTKGKMTVTYEDESGKTASVEKEFKLEVTEPVEDVVMGEPMEEEENGFPIMPVIIAIIVIAGVAAAVVLIRRKKKKQMLSEEEDLSDEVDRFTEDE